MLGWENQSLEFNATLSFNLSSVEMIRTFGALRIVEGRMDELTKKTAKN